jgi:hypothetical protein
MDMGGYADGYAGGRGMHYGGTCGPVRPPWPPTGVGTPPAAAAAPAARNPLATRGPPQMPPQYGTSQSAPLIKPRGAGAAKPKAAGGGRRKVMQRIPASGGTGNNAAGD